MSSSGRSTTDAPRRVLSRPGVGTTTHVVQGRRFLATRVYSPQSLLVLVLRGRKYVTSSGLEQVAVAGDAVALPAGSTVDLANEPARDGPYEAISIIYDEALSTAPAPATAPLTRPLVLRSVGVAFEEAIRRARAALVDAETIPDRVARHRMVEVLAWMAESGLAFPWARTVSARGRLRALVANDPGGGWSTRRAATALAVSEATLRRRLAAEGETLTSLVQDIRMTNAMMLLQATDDPVIQVALACGFSHPSSFARLFRIRFGLSPTQVRRTDS